jgi:general secretion pathway protein J
MNHYQRDSGFTLLELLLALTLSAMVMLILAAGLNVILNEWTRSGNYLDDSLERTLILLQIERALQGAFPHTYLNEEENKKTIFFEGEENKLTWVSTVSPGRQPGLTVWQLLPSKDDEGVAIRLVPAFANDPTELLEQEEQETIAFKSYKASFQYLYVDEKIEDDTKWLDEWSGKERQGLPNAVRIHLENTEDAEQSVEIVATILAHEHQTLRSIKP